MSTRLVGNTDIKYNKNKAKNKISNVYNHRLNYLKTTEKLLWKKSRKMEGNGGCRIKWGSVINESYKSFSFRLSRDLSVWRGRHKINL